MVFAGFARESAASSWPEERPSVAGCSRCDYAAGGFPVPLLLLLLLPPGAVLWPLHHALALPPDSGGDIKVQSAS